MSKRVYVNRKPVEGPWGGGNHFLHALRTHAPEFGYEPIFEPTGAVDLIFLFDPRDDGLGPSLREIADVKRSFPTLPIVHRINECDARKNTDFMDQLLRECSGITDATVFVSEWLATHLLDKGLRDSSNYVIYNGVDAELYSSGQKFENGRINLVTHHWSDHPLKGFDIYTELDRWLEENPLYSFTYIGRERGEFKNTSVIPPLFGKALGDELGRYDCYISASRYDPGPNHVLESLSCGIPTFVHAEGGGAVEFAGRSHSYSNFDELVSLLKKTPYEPNHGFALQSWRACIQQFCEVFDRVTR